MHSISNTVSTNTRLIFLLVLLSLAGLQGCTAVIVGGSIGTAVAVGSDRRDSATILEDQAIEIKVTDSIYTDSVLGKEVNITVTCYNGVVLLTGEAPTEALRLRAAEIAKPLRNVRKIYNEVRVTRRLSMFEQSHDGWLTTKVKTQLINERGLITHTKVISSNGIVYMLGLVDKREADEAYRIASDMRGIDDVIALFERTDLPVDSSERFSRTVFQAKPAQNTVARPASNEDEDVNVLDFDLQPTAEMPLD